MNKTWIQFILVLSLAACTALQTETPLPPAETSDPATPTPNPYAEDAFIKFCDSAYEGDVEKALQLFTEDIRIVITGDETYEGFSGVEGFLNVLIQMKIHDCTVNNFQINGDKVKFKWTHSWDKYFDYTTKAICTCNATMQGDKIQKVSYNCEFIDIKKE